MITKEVINNELKAALNQTADGKVVETATSAVNQLNALFESKPATLGDIASGMKIIAQDVLNNTAPTKKPVIGKMTSNIPGISVTETSSQSSSISILTGRTASNGFLKAVTTSVSPKGIKSTLETTTSAKPDQINNAIKTVSTSPDFVEAAAKLDDVGKKPFSGFTDQVKIQKLEFNKLLGNPADLLKTPAGFSNSPFNQLGNFVSKSLGFDPIKSIGTELKNVFDTEAETYLGGGLKVVDKFDTSDAPKKVINEFGITNVSEFLEASPDIDNRFKITSVPQIVGEVGDFSGAAIPDQDFTFVESIEELILEIRNSTRDFSYVEIDITEEYTDENISSEEWHQLYSSSNLKAQGWDGVPFHYLIRKNGSIQRGRPLDIETVYPLGKYDKQKSIVIWLSAGYSVPYGTEGAQLNLSFTDGIGSLNTIVDIIFKSYPGIPFFSSEILEQLGFDMGEYIKLGWDKYNPNITRNNFGSGPLLRSSVNSARNVVSASY